MARKKRGKSIFDRALGPSGRKRRRKKGGGLAGAFETASGGRRKKGRKDLASHLDSMVNTRSARKQWRIVNQAGESLRRRMTKTEKMQAQDALDDALEFDPEVRKYYQNERVTGNESWLRRLAALVRRRVGLFGTGK